MYLVSISQGRGLGVALFVALGKESVTFFLDCLELLAQLIYIDIEREREEIVCVCVCVCARARARRGRW
jgi:hypothetical protein